MPNCFLSLLCCLLMQNSWNPKFCWLFFAISSILCWMTTMRCLITYDYRLGCWLTLFCQWSKLSVGGLRGGKHFGIVGTYAAESAMLMIDVMGIALVLPFWGLPWNIENLCLQDAIVQSSMPLSSLFRLHLYWLSRTNLIPIHFHSLRRLAFGLCCALA